MHHLSEVRQFENALLRNQQIRRLEISMDNGIAMTRIEPIQDLDHPSLDLSDGNPSTSTLSVRVPLGVGDDGGEISREELEDEDGVLIFAPEVLVESDDVGRIVEGLEGFDLSEGALVVVDLFEGDDQAVRETAGAVDVGVGAGTDTLEDFVTVGDIRAGVDAPATRGERRRIHGDGAVVKKQPRVVVVVIGDSSESTSRTSEGKCSRAELQ